MSHNEDSDLTFNQKYAGRSRVRRDLNTIKNKLVHAVTGAQSGKTVYRLRSRVAGTHQAYFTFTIAAGTTIQSGAQTIAWDNSALDNAEANICIFRGPNDVPGDSLYGKLPSATLKEHITVLHANFKVTTILTKGVGATVDCDISLGANTGTTGFGRTSIVDGQTGSIDGGAAAFVTNYSSVNRTLPDSANQAGTRGAAGIFPAWENTTSGTTVLAGGTDPTMNTYAPGVWLNLKVNTSATNVSALTGGKIIVRIVYAIDPY